MTQIQEQAIKGLEKGSMTPVEAIGCFMVGLKNIEEIRKFNTILGEVVLPILKEELNG